jgi:hypothetical protein
MLSRSVMKRYPIGELKSSAPGEGLLLRLPYRVVASKLDGPGLSLDSVVEQTKLANSASSRQASPFFLMKEVQL